ncbi:MAG: DNA/RNA non-specific endonuclease [Bryobacteraceae bacterium]
MKYFNYSVVMNKERKLAFFAAVNIDGGQQQEIGKRTGDKWYRDPRIDENHQLGDEFYKKQTEVETDRTKNPFDRGHLVRRLDATWGKTVEIAKEHGDDSFHFTNCSPQFWRFNEGKRLWLGLEDYTRNKLLAQKNKGVIINGPVFDGPDAEKGKLPRPGDRAHKDPTFGGLKIPKYFWKIMATARDGKLVALGFLMSQRDQLLDIDRIKEADFEFTDASIRVYQYSIADLAKLTKLDFGKLATVDLHEAAAEGPRHIESFDDIRLG